MINTYIQTYVKDKTQLTLYKNNTPVFQTSVLPYGINIVFTQPATSVTDLETFFVLKFLNLLSTNIGERIMFPNYGVNFQIEVFENNEKSIISGLESTLKSKLQKYLPQITIQNINVTSLDIDKHSLSLQFSLSLNPTNSIVTVNYNT